MSRFFSSNDQSSHVVSLSWLYGLLLPCWVLRNSPPAQNIGVPFASISSVKNSSPAGAVKPILRAARHRRLPSRSSNFDYRTARRDFRGRSPHCVFGCRRRDRRGKTRHERLCSSLSDTVDTHHPDRLETSHRSRIVAALRPQPCRHRLLQTSGDHRGIARSIVARRVRGNSALTSRHQCPRPPPPAANQTPAPPRSTRSRSPETRY